MPVDQSGSSELDNRGDHEAESAKDGQVHDEGARDASTGPARRVANREEQSAHEDEALQDQGPDRVSEGADDSAQNEEGDVLEEVDLAALRVVEFEPIGVGQFLREVAISGVGIAVLGGMFLPRESLAVDLIELLHELAREGLYAGAHGHGVDGHQVLQGDSQG
eukprot:CAMPEP_0170468742 /NCGR_PEP_ID=MMETSP0123-20130129/11805_1 /TAXON_ID=182087 /ORGANISM="Favella ehrenbergii, Strain Fehren 1" /LENGTH=163 /DNA_ID=CAMNT_0010735381 /DNA_START=106 /DNA_END=597 /DNA_ORIENTATION=+